MAVARMKRALIMGHADDADALTRSLQRNAVVHVEKTRLVETDRDPERVARLEEEHARLGDRLDDARFVLDLLERFRTPPERPFATFISEKFHIGLAEFEGIEGRLNFDHLLAVCREAERELADLDLQAAPLGRARLALMPWSWLDVPLGSLQGTRRTMTQALGGEVEAFEHLSQVIREAGLAAEVIASEGIGLVIVHRQHVQEVLQSAEELDLAPVELPVGERTPAEELARLQVEQAAIDERRREVEDRVRSLAPLYGDVLALVRNLENAVGRIEARRRFGATGRVVFVEGWVRADRTAALAEALAPFEAVDVSLADPLPDEDPPVELANPRWLQPFELLTRLYGMPAYRELDPTPMLAGPFALFFGICMGDAGYGLLLILAGALMLRKLDIAENPRRFMWLMIYGGSFAMVFGVLTGSYFAIDANLLPAFMRGAILFDPLYESVIFFILSISLGVIHVTWGVVLEAVDELRNGGYYQAFAVQGSTLLTLVAGVVAVATWIASVVGGELPAPVAGLSALSLKGLLLGAAGMVLTSGGFFDPLAQALRKGVGLRGWIDRLAGGALALAAVAWVAGAVIGIRMVSLEGVLLLAAVALVASPAGRRMVVRALLGLYNLYGMTGFIGDILSYARLMALGLASLLIGSTVNRMVGLLLSGLPAWPGVSEPGRLAGFVAVFLLVGLGGLLILVAGHVFNVVVNLLGSFVHPMRLQFVEFFSKFYEGKGRPFRPLAYTTGVLVLDESET